MRKGPQAPLYLFRSQANLLGGLATGWIKGCLGCFCKGVTMSPFWPGAPVRLGPHRVVWRPPWVKVRKDRTCVIGLQLPQGVGQGLWQPQPARGTPNHNFQSLALKAQRVCALAQGDRVHVRSMSNGKAEGREWAAGPEATLT